ncbi:hypothetical protein DIPPA_34423 [Diplonema papillatum]|nr:hypothetical protein DIPPA_34423 [Diplonema papillatum]
MAWACPLCAKSFKTADSCNVHLRESCRRNALLPEKARVRDVADWREDCLLREALEAVAGPQARENDLLHKSLKAGQFTSRQRALGNDPRAAFADAVDRLPHKDEAAWHRERARLAPPPKGLLRGGQNADEPRDPPGAAAAAAAAGVVEALRAISRPESAHAAAAAAADEPAAAQAGGTRGANARHGGRRVWRLAASRDSPPRAGSGFAGPEAPAAPHDDLRTGTAGCCLPGGTGPPRAESGRAEGSRNAEFTALTAPHDDLRTGTAGCCLPGGTGPPRAESGRAEGSRIAEFTALEAPHDDWRKNGIAGFDARCLPGGTAPPRAESRCVEFSRTPGFTALKVTAAPHDGWQAGIAVFDAYRSGGERASRWEVEENTVPYAQGVGPHSAPLEPSPECARGVAAANEPVYLVLPDDVSTVTCYVLRGVFKGPTLHCALPKRGASVVYSGCGVTVTLSSPPAATGGCRKAAVAAALASAARVPALALPDPAHSGRGDQPAGGHFSDEQPRLLADLRGADGGAKRRRVLSRPVPDIPEGSRPCAGVAVEHWRDFTAAEAEARGNVSRNLSLLVGPGAGVEAAQDVFKQLEDAFLKQSKRTPPLAT